MCKNTMPNATEEQPLIKSNLSVGSNTTVGSWEDYDSTESRQATPTKKRSSSSSPAKFWLWKHVDKGAFQFALRMAVLLTISSLFVLIRSPSYHFPDGMWVLVSVLFVSWFPSLDAASVIEKVIQRLIGTFVGAFLGLSCGFCSLALFTDRTYQATFLGVCMFLFCFGIIFLAGQCKVGGVKVIKRFAYATILCTLTYCICMLPFACESDPKWVRAFDRVINVIIGCAMGAVGSIVLCPTSTTDVLHNKAARQVQMAGDASEAVLHVAAEFFAGTIQVNRLADELLATKLDSELEWKLRKSSIAASRIPRVDSGTIDVALKKYEDAIADWKASKLLFPLTKYDPFYRHDEADTKMREFHTEVSRTLARALRIQTTIVVMDGMIRSDATYSFTDTQLASFSTIGSLIRQMLTIPIDTARSRNAARALFDKLEDIRADIRGLSVAPSVAQSEQEHAESELALEEFKNSLLSNDSAGDPEEDEMGRGIPRDTTGSRENALFFLQLVEHLIFRSLRLYQAWKDVPKQP